MSSEKLNPLHLLLKIPFVYTLVQNILSRSGSKEFIWKTYIAAEAGQTILDLGCGPAGGRKFLGDVKYTGVDFNAKHISIAKDSHPTDTFVHADIFDYLQTGTTLFDKIIMIGVLHHLDDAKAQKVVRLIKSRLKPGGRLITLDPLFEQKQSIIPLLLAKLDQGNHVRYEEEYKTLVASSYSNVQTTIKRNLSKLPYCLLFMTCSN